MSLGTRLAADVLAEMSFHLVEPLTSSTLTVSVAPGSPVTLTLDPSSPLSLPAAPLPPTSNLYPGAFVIVDYRGTTPEIAEVTAVLSSTQFTVASLVYVHSAGATLFAPTLPTQQPTDPIFTQAELLGYLAQAQNEFLARVPLIFQLSTQIVSLGVTYQAAPVTAIEIERVAVQSTPAASTFTLSTVTRAADVVTAVLAATSLTDPSGAWTAGLGVQISGVTDSSYDSPATGATYPLLSVSPDGLTLTWAQTGANSSSTGGSVSRPVLTRLYESTQEQLSLNQPSWQVQQGAPPTQWAEDRAGIYGWLVMPPPAGAFWMELLTSSRGPTFLTLLSSFAVPDIFVPYLKYKALEYCWSKDGVQRSPTLARFARGRFDFGVLLADRFLRNAISKVGKAGAAAGGPF
jgi:hypothetical protein